MQSVAAMVEANGWTAGANDPGVLLQQRDGPRDDVIQPPVRRVGARPARYLSDGGNVAAVEDDAAATPEAGHTDGYVVGLDPETLEVVRRGSKRDEELRQKYVFWSNGYVAG